MKRKIIVLTASLLTFAVLVLSAMGICAVEIVFDGVTFYNDDSLLIDGVTYVPLRNCLQTRFGYDVGWNQNTSTAFITADGLEISCRVGDRYITANGRYLWNDSPNIIKDGKMFIPLRTLAKALGGIVKWDAKTKTAYVELGGGFIKNADSFYNKDELYWLSRIINAESGVEPLRGKIAVGNVVLNRVKSADFPNNIKDVIFDNKFGVQFTPTSNGTIYNEPNAESVVAAKICLEGYTVTQSALYFINDALATSHWVSNNCAYVMSIGSHDFYA